MPKRVFWPASLIVMGLVLIATVMGMLPQQFLIFWLLVLIIVGLGGLLTSDREEWMTEEKKAAPASKKAKKPAVKAKKSARKKK